MDKKLKILVKFPTRERTQKFITVIQRYILYSSDKDNVEYLITLDENDPRRNMYMQFVSKLNNARYIIGNSTGKIHACNRDMEQSGEWDIVLLASDDMICQKVGWDEMLRTEMIKHYPDLDGVLFHNDGHQHSKLNTMCIMGRKYYERFNYIYHPDYTSLWCDNEFMDVAESLGKQTYFEECLFRHEHYSNGRQYHSTADPLLRKNETFYKKDEEVYKKRKLEGFPNGK